MNAYSNDELVDMLLVYGAADCNGHAARRLYQERYPNRRVPYHATFASVNRRLRETGSLMRVTMNRRRTTRTTGNEEAVLRLAEDNPRTSTRAIAQQLGLPQCIAWRILAANNMSAYHLQRVQLLKPEDYPLRKAFATWFLQQSATDRAFAASVLFTDEAYFTRDGVFNQHNAHVWALDNPHSTQPRAAQERFSVTVWAGILGDYVIGPYLLPSRLDGRAYLIFLQQVLPELLDAAHVPPSLRHCMWYQHDGAPPHYTADVRRHLDVTFGQRWIGRGGPIHWPARSPDLSCLDFFFWGHIKSLVYETPVTSVEDLIARISVAAGRVRDMPGIFQNVRNSMQRRCQACLTTSGRNFEHLL